MANTTNLRSIMTDESGDYIIRNGTFVYGDTTIQHQEDILLANPGDYPYSPLTGVGIRRYILDDASPLTRETEIQKQFEADGMKVLINKNNKVVAEYK